MKNVKLNIAIALLLAVASTTGALAQDSKPGNDSLALILEKITTLERRIDQIESRLNDNSRATSTTDPVADIATQLESLDQQIKIAERKRELGREEDTARLATTPIVTAGDTGF